MDEHSLQVLEFDRVTGIVAGYAASEAGKMAVSRMLPAADRETIQALLNETREFTQILQSGETPPLDGIYNIGQAIEKLGVAGSMLTPGELLHTAMTLSAGRRVKRFFQRFDGTGIAVRIAAPLLCLKAESIHPSRHIEDAVLSAVDDQAEVRDSASPELRKIRRQIARTRDDILSHLSGILQNSGLQKVIQEPVITVRDDRYVLPLKPHFRQSIRGVVHGQSGSRATLFVEPLDVLEQNNRLAELRMEEREEVERILRDLTNLLARDGDAIRTTVYALAEIDAICARARFGIDLDGTVPELSEAGRLQLWGARHPLLAWKQKIAGAGDVTPNDIELSSDKRALILSGPNAGGKTVILKTVGLLSLMTQAGLPITAAEGSVLPHFGSIFADIGDEQNIDQDLSTFSSHAGHIAAILREAGRDSLVLLDELGSGTDPIEGAGLGAAVIDSLIERGALTLVTTHHNALKLFGAETSGAVNAAMEFDPQTLKPTYHLIPGRPGRSYGLDMAARIGVPDAVIQNARSRIGEDEMRLENLLRQVEADAQKVATEREALECELAAARLERNEAEAALRTAHDEARGIKTKAKAEAREVLASLRQKLRELSRAEALDRAEARKMAAEIEAQNRQLEPTGPEQAPDIPALMPDLHSGDRVRIPRWNRAATVLASARGILELDVDGKKVRLSARDIMPIECLQRQQNGPGVQIRGWSADLAVDDNPPDRINIIGWRVDEGLAQVERLIDRAGVNGLSIVTVIHGLGTGALKTAVTEYLKSHPLVASIRSGEPSEGGAGVTVTELKK